MLAQTNHLDLNLSLQGNTRSIAKRFSVNLKLAIEGGCLWAVKATARTWIPGSGGRLGSEWAAIVSLCFLLARD